MTIRFSRRFSRGFSRRELVAGSLGVLAGCTASPRLPGKAPVAETKPGCVFCQIVAGQREATVVWQDAIAIAFGSLYAIQPGHILLVPRTHAEDLLTLPEPVAAHLLPVAARLARALKSELDADGVTLLQNNGEASGQTVFHFHLHLIPRHSGREIYKWVDEELPASTPEEREAVLGPVRKALASKG